MRIAVIPARGGSKRIPRKNIRPFAGRPMIARSIDAAREAGVFDMILCSTDDEEIAGIARQAGASTPFLRPAELADDHTPTAPVLRHALQWCLDNGMDVDTLCCIYATAPFVRAQDIRRGLELLDSRGADAAFSVTSFAFPIFRALTVNEAGRLQMLWPEHRNTRSQDLPGTCHDAGQFYWLRAEPFLRTGLVYTPDALPVHLPRHLVQDIDTPEDWLRAEWMFEAMRLSTENAQA